MESFSFISLDITLKARHALSVTYNTLLEANLTHLQIEMLYFQYNYRSKND